MADESGKRRANPFDAPAVVAGYEAWYAGPGKRADELETRLLGKLIGRFPGARNALEVGCGTGHLTRWLQSRGLATTGLDASRAMLRQAKALGTPRCLQADGHALPVQDGSFDVVVLITTLEFVADPGQALREALRVARRGLLLGVLNRVSLLAVRRRMSPTDWWQAARFFSVSEVKRLLTEVGGRRIQRIEWRTTLWPVPCVPDLPLPWGGFIGLAVHVSHAAPPQVAQRAGTQKG